MLGKAGRSETFPGLNKMSTPYPCPPSPQASAYLKQNKYQQAEELYKEILSQEALHGGIPHTCLHVPSVPQEPPREAQQAIHSSR